MFKSRMPFPLQFGGNIIPNFGVSLCFGGEDFHSNSEFPMIAGVMEAIFLFS